YNLLNLALQLTPLRKRGCFRTFFVGKPLGPGYTYTCSELVVEALVYAGLLPAETTRPGATYPRDRSFDQSYNLSIATHLNIKDSWEVPRWWPRCYVPATPCRPGSQRMTPGVFLLCALAAQPAPDELPFGCVGPACHNLKTTPVGPLEPYRPQVGDVIL